MFWNRPGIILRLRPNIIDPTAKKTKTKHDQKKVFVIGNVPM